MHLFSPAAARNLLTSTLWPKHTQHQPGHLSTEPVFRYLHLANCKNCTVQCCKTLNNTFSTKIVKLKFDLFIWQFDGEMTTVSRVLCLCAAVSSGEWLVAELLVTNCPELSGIVTNTNNETLISCQLPRYFSLSSAFDQPFVHLSVRGQNWN